MWYNFPNNPQKTVRCSRSNLEEGVDIAVGIELTDKEITHISGDKKLH